MVETYMALIWRSFSLP